MADISVNSPYLYYITHCWSSLNNDDNNNYRKLITGPFSPENVAQHARAQWTVGRQSKSFILRLQNPLFPSQPFDGNDIHKTLSF